MSEAAGSGPRAPRAAVAGLTLLLAALAVGCQSAMTVEEARRVAGETREVPLDRAPATPAVVPLEDQEESAPADARALADAPAPATADRNVLADFYYRRAGAALALGRQRQRREDATRAAELVLEGATGRGDFAVRVLWRAADAEMGVGNFGRGARWLEAALARLTPADRAWAITLNSQLVRAVVATDLPRAEKALAALRALEAESRATPGREPQTARTQSRALETAWIAGGEAMVAEAHGRWDESLGQWRRSVAAFESLPGPARPTAITNRGRLAFALMRAGRLAEAEAEARRAVEQSRRASRTLLANQLRRLGRILTAQGRREDAEVVVRQAVEVYESAGGDPATSSLAASARRELIAALAALERWPAAVAEYDALQVRMQDNALFRRVIASDPDTAIALIRVGRHDEAARVIARGRVAAERRYGADHSVTAEYRAIRGLLEQERKRPRVALADFAAAGPFLLDPDLDADDDSLPRTARERRRQWVVEAHLHVLAFAAAQGLELAEAVAATSFQVADAARGHVVRRALDAAGARFAADVPGLADLIRDEQDTTRRIVALYAQTGSDDGASAGEGRDRAAGLRQQITRLEEASRTLRARIEREFPKYSTLMNPPPATLDDVQTALRPGEALLATYVGERRTFVWALAPARAARFVEINLSRGELTGIVRKLRAGLDATDKTLEEIPDFDVAIAHGLYQRLLEPVREVWEGAEVLFVVPHGPLGELPFAALPTKPAVAPTDPGARFSRYRDVAWLGRTHALAVLPSPASLVTLRALPPSKVQRPLVAFADPIFSRTAPGPGGPAAVSSRGAGFSVRAVPPRPTGAAGAAGLASLPRLPDTADEALEIAQALGAPRDDVFLGVAASERNVKTRDLSRYRVVIFATHGLVPGELDGLTQPALALASPEVAGGEGDGLLTANEILGLRLDADWVVLSACNTGAGASAGAEAVSGLGRAFFYAGARAILVTQWPVETTSARALTTGLFRSVAANAGTSRARALRDAMTALIEGPGRTDERSGRVLWSYAHPLFWASFMLVGDGGR